MSTYVERLHPSVAFWLLVPIAGLLAGASAVPLGAWVAVGAGAASAIVVAALLTWRTPVVRVDASGLHAGAALLDPPSIGVVEALDRDATRQAMGPELRADAYVVHRAWIGGAVRVSVDDDADPTPYWLVSTRHPETLAAALEQHRASGSPQPGDASSPQAAHSEQTGCPPSS